MFLGEKQWLNDPLSKEIRTVGMSAGSMQCESRISLSPVVTDPGIGFHDDRSYPHLSKASCDLEPCLSSTNYMRLGKCLVESLITSEITYDDLGVTFDIGPPFRIHLFPRQCI